MRRINVLCCLVLTLAATAATAGAQENGWHLRLGGVWLEPDAEIAEDDGAGNSVEVGAGDGIGLSLALERRFNRRLGLELGALSADPEIDFNASLAGGSQVAVSEDLGFDSITLPWP